MDFAPQLAYFMVKNPTYVSLFKAYLGHRYMNGLDQLRAPVWFTRALKAIEV